VLASATAALLEQTAPTELVVRLRPAPGADPDQIWSLVQCELTDLLADNGLDHVTTHRTDEAPQPATGGKYRLVHPLADPHRHRTTSIKRPSGTADPRRVRGASRHCPDPRRVGDPVGPAGQRMLVSVAVDRG
jgi:hypothetical protein